MVAVVVGFAVAALVIGVLAGKLATARSERDSFESTVETLGLAAGVSDANYWNLSKEAQDLAAKYRKLLSQKKSSEVRTGLIAENMAPFLEGFPYAPKDAIFMGNPLDFVVFDDEGVHFVEVKSGKSQLNSKQRRLRDLIQRGSVTFEIYRVKGEK